jgi:hypothetical protein
VYEDLREFSGRDDELWDEIDSVIPVTTELSGRRLITAKLSIELSKPTELTIRGTYHVGRRPG